MHQPVVIKVRRSCAAFETEIINELNLGSYDFFYDKVKKEGYLRFMSNYYIVI